MTKIAEYVQSFSVFMEEIGQFPVLTKDEEFSLFQRVRSGDERAREEAIKKNIRFVVHLAKPFVNRGISLEDLVQEGNIGLITAVDSFDPDRGPRFAAYAVWWIRNAIFTALASYGTIVKVPRNRNRIVGIFPATMSLDAPRNQTTKGGETYESFERTTAISPLSYAEAESELRHAQRQTALMLGYVTILPDSPRNKEIFVRRVTSGSFDGLTKTLESVGEECSVTRQRTQQIVDRIWNRLGYLGNPYTKFTYEKELVRVEMLEEVLGVGTPRKIEPAQFSDEEKRALLAKLPLRRNPPRRKGRKRISRK